MPDGEFVHSTQCKGLLTNDFNNNHRIIYTKNLNHGHGDQRQATNDHVPMESFNKKMDQRAIYRQLFCSYWVTSLCCTDG